MRLELNLHPRAQQFHWQRLMICCYRSLKLGIICYCSKSWLIRSANKTSLLCYDSTWTYLFLSVSCPNLFFSLQVHVLTRQLVPWGQKLSPLVSFMAGICLIKNKYHNTQWWKTSRHEQQILTAFKLQQSTRQEAKAYVSWDQWDHLSWASNPERTSNSATCCYFQKTWITSHCIMCVKYVTFPSNI